uniref:Uncharacterized protein n=1 Tax=Lepeophtheirus salmonis TaxID=72036 RepID=A0A0K2TYF3_LEPSM
MQGHPPGVDSRGDFLNYSTKRHHIRGSISCIINRSLVAKETYSETLHFFYISILMKMMRVNRNSTWNSFRRNRKTETRRRIEGFLANERSS